MSYGQKALSAGRRATFGPGLVTRRHDGVGLKAILNLAHPDVAGHETEGEATPLLIAVTIIVDQWSE